MAHADPGHGRSRPDEKDLDAGAGELGSEGDRAFVVRAQAGDYQAFEALVRRYRERLYRLAYSMLGNRAEAHEIVQETFLQAFRGLASFRQDSAAGTWLYRIAVNATLMRLRTRRRKPLLSLETLPAEGPATGSGSLWPAGDWAKQPDDALDSHELRRHIGEAIAQLPEKYRLVLLLRDVEGQTTEEVAQTLGLTVPTVKSRLHRSRLIVRRELEHYFAKGR